MSIAFISYSWDDDLHKEWVLSLAKKLQNANITVKLDQLDLRLGDELTEYMETSIRDSDKVLIICTPTYKMKSDKRLGGVGYEESIITGEVFNTRNNRKFIPILRKGTWKEAAPTWLTSKVYSDFSGNFFDDVKYKELIQNITDFKDDLKSEKSAPIVDDIVHVDNTESEDICIKGIIVEEVTVPKMDGTRGSALYAIPFKLSKHPTRIWGELFIQTWQHPPKFTLMHRSNIARISGDKIILDGTTIEEVEKYHKETLQLCVSETNKKEKAHLQEVAYRESLERDRVNKHKKQLFEDANKIKFD